MPNILDHVSPTPVLEVDVWPRSASRKEWFAITRRIIQDTIADMDLDPAAEAEVIEACTGAIDLFLHLEYSKQMTKETRTNCP